MGLLVMLGAGTAVLTWEWVDRQYVAYSSRKKIIPMNEIFLLNETQISELAPAAEMGDGEAAYKLYQHYAFAKVDLAVARYYLEIAAKAGNPRAKESLRVQALNRRIMR